MMKIRKRILGRGCLMVGSEIYVYATDIYGFMNIKRDLDIIAKYCGGNGKYLMKIH